MINFISFRLGGAYYQGVMIDRGEKDTSGEYYYHIAYGIDGKNNCRQGIVYNYDNPNKLTQVLAMGQLYNDFEIVGMR